MNLCMAAIHSGRRYGSEPEPDEFCPNEAEPGMDFCAIHMVGEDEA